MGAWSAPAWAEGYTVHPGDVLGISVWKEPDLQREVLVRPDGGLSFPLAGDMVARGRTVEAIQDALAERLARFIPDPVVTVTVQQVAGNRLYVLGKVNQPGMFVMAGPTDVMQALSMAGGTNPFAKLNDIKILRRTDDGQEAISFRYGDVADGEDLEQNIVLQSGDVVVVP